MMSLQGNVDIGIHYTKKNKAIIFTEMFKVCREQQGSINMPAYDNGHRKIKAHKRRRMVPKKLCDCEPELRGRFVAAAAPDDNLIENVNGYLRQTLWKMVQSGEEEWKGSVANKMMIIRRAINKINENRSYFWRLFRSHRVELLLLVAMSVNNY